MRTASCIDVVMASLERSSLRTLAPPETRRTSGTFDPGSIEVKFASCATCTRSEGTLLQGGTLIEEKLDLAPAATSWIPVAVLAPNSAFSVEIVHVALAP